jgi:addiction module HigA family antidote
LTTIDADSRVYTRAEVDAGMVDLGGLANGKRIPPTHPGDILREDFLKPLGMTTYRLAKVINVPLNRVTAIAAGKRAVSADTALRLGRAFSMNPDFWLRLQARYDLEVARGRLSKRIAREVQPFVPPARAA